MVPLNTVIPGVILLVCILFFPLIVQAAIRMKAAGKFLCGIVEKGKPLKFMMKKIVEGEFIEDRSDKWFIRDEQVKLVDYPLMWPKALGLFKQSVPCSLYMRGRSEPLDWESPSLGSLSSKELAVILDPYWLRALVAGVTAEGGLKPSRFERILTLLAVTGVIIYMVLIFVVLAKLGTLEQAIKVIR